MGAHEDLRRAKEKLDTKKREIKRKNEAIQQKNSNSAMDNWLDSLQPANQDDRFEPTGDWEIDRIAYIPFIVVVILALLFLIIENG
ncbi:hypothetical protein [Dyadobacter psychrotolerans]|uniref:Uncharacterized protein n=1 Tax=Dyadobacter psychrotolerans TaxID=2541721 RepID=A0A4R5DYS9_9BACT|nr:hypothetical protein [Dyadobacter psychrotolerans]TDE17690.1 hypothetical protein E0F88_07310 [Dyadobacter psychrotolerans]